MNYELIFHTLIVTLILGSYVYTNRSMTKVYRYLNNHLTARVREIVKEVLEK